MPRKFPREILNFDNLKPHQWASPLVESYQISSLAANSLALLPQVVLRCHVGDYGADKKRAPRVISVCLEIPFGAWVLLGKRLLALTSCVSAEAGYWRRDR